MKQKKKLTVYDATKEELIQYFFKPLANGLHVNASAERFVIWLEEHRTKKILDAQDQEIENSQQAFHEYITYLKQANDEKDLDKKLAIFEKANKAYKRYEQAEERQKRLDKEIDSYLYD